MGKKWLGASRILQAKKILVFEHSLNRVIYGRKSGKRKIEHKNDITSNSEQPKSNIDAENTGIQTKKNKINILI